MLNELVLAELSTLTPQETKAYEKYVKKDGAALAPSVQAQLFGLYLNGSSCEAIAELNKNFTLGMIVKARVDGLWEQKRIQHLQELLDTTKDRVTQVQLESALFAADMLASAHKLDGVKFKKFLQTGDESVLGELKIASIKQYRDVVDLLMKVTGQDQKQQVTVTGGQTHTVEIKTKMTPAEAAGILALVETTK